MLDTRPARLTTPPIQVSEVELPGGATLGTRDIASDIGIADVYLGQMWDDLSHALSSNDQERSALKALEDKLTTALAAAEIATSGSDEAGVMTVQVRGVSNGEREQ